MNKGRDDVTGGKIRRPLRERIDSGRDGPNSPVFDDSLLLGLELESRVGLPFDVSSYQLSYRYRSLLLARTS